MILALTRETHTWNIIISGQWSLVTQVSGQYIPSTMRLDSDQPGEVTVALQHDTTHLQVSQSLPGHSVRSQSGDAGPRQVEMVEVEDAREGEWFDGVEIRIVRQVHNSQVKIVVESRHLNSTEIGSNIRLGQV